METLPALQAPRASASIPQAAPAPPSAPLHVADAARIITAASTKTTKPRGFIARACIEGISLMGYSPLRPASRLSMLA